MGKRKIIAGAKLLASGLAAAAGAAVWDYMMSVDPAAVFGITDPKMLVLAGAAGAVLHSLPSPFKR